MAAAASCCVNWLVPLRPAGVIAFVLTYSFSRRHKGATAPLAWFNASTSIPFATILKAHFRVNV
jgi:hypothetical protein